MRIFMEIVKEQSIRAAKEIMDKEAIEASKRLARECTGDSKRSHGELLEEIGFNDSTRIHMNGNKSHFDAYSEKWKVGIEREMREQMNVRSHLLFADIAYQTGMIKATVFILPIKGKNTKADFSRTLNDLIDSELFAKYFPLEVPIYLIGVE